MDSSVARSAASASKALEGIKKSANLVKNAIGVALGAVSVHAVFEFTKSCLDAAASSESVAKQTAAVLESTKGVSGMTAKSVSELATSLQSVTTYDDEAIASAENLLLTFTKIGKDTMPGATEAVLNMSTALGQDTKSSAVQLGKALNDPIKGITALQRVGVTFTDTQKKQIAAMVKVGDVAGAQKVILNELNTEFGGSARAAADTYAGSVMQMQNSWENVKETLGGGVLPIATKLMKALTGLFNGSVSPEMFGAQISGVINDLVTKISGALPAALNTGAQIIVSVAKGVVSNLPQIATAIISVVPTLITSLTGMLPDLVAAGAQVLIALIQGLAQAAPTLIPQVVQAILTAINVGIQNAPLVLQAGMQLLQGLADGLLKALPILIQMLPTIVESYVSYLENNLPQIIEVGIQIVIALINGLVEALPKLLEMLPTLIEKIVSALMDNLPILLKGVLQIIWALAKAIVKLFPLITDAIGKSIAAIFTAVWNKLQQWQNQLTTAVGQLFINAFKGVADWVSGVWNNVVTAIKTAFSGIGDWFSGLWEGIKQTFKSIINFFIDEINSLTGGINTVTSGGLAQKLGIAFTIPPIPRLANGGIIKHGGGGILANIGEGRYDEAVVPLRNGGSLGGGNFTFSPQIIIQGNASKKVIQDALQDAQVEFEKRMEIYLRKQRRVAFG